MWGEGRDLRDSLCEENKGQEWKKNPKVCKAAGLLHLVAFFLWWLFLPSLWISLKYVLSTNTSVKFWLGKSLHKVLLMALQGLWLGCCFLLPVHQFYLFSLTLVAKVTTSLPRPTPNIQYLFQLKAVRSSESVCSCQEQPKRDMKVPKSLP